jgi:cleavage and polyadenylation specificity factor subunit 2
MKVKKHEVSTGFRVSTGWLGAGNVLIPCDTAGRCLELALILQQAWKTQRLPYTIVFLTTVAYSTLEFAKSQLEWMNQDISEAFNKNKANPFEFR